MTDEIRALSRLAFDELGGTPAGISGIHRAIADRTPLAGGPRALHDAIAGVAYGAVGAGFALAGRAADAALARRRATGRELSTTPRGAAALAAVGGLIGDALEREGSDLVEPMALRAGGRVADPGSFEQATPDVVVFVHGLF
jgi:hypothetical protein